MESTIKNIVVGYKDCIGCLRAERDIMVTMLTHDKSGGGTNFDDYFLTTEQARHLIKKLTDALEHNHHVNEEEVESGRKYWRLLKTIN